MASCVIDFAEKNKEVLTKDEIDGIARQDRAMKKRYANDPAKLAEEQSKAIEFWDEKIKHSSANRLQTVVKEKEIISNINEFADSYKKRKNVEVVPATDLEETILAVTEGSNDPRVKLGRLSIFNKMKLKVTEAEKFFFGYLEDNGLMKYTKKEHMVPIFEAKKRMIEGKESIDIKDVGPNPYDQIAAAMIRTDNYLQEKTHMAGLYQGYKPSFMQFYSHDSMKIARHGRDPWKKAVLEALDPDQPFFDTPEGASAEIINDILDETFNMITRGDFAEFDSHRNFNWANVDASIRYNDLYGSGGSWDAMYTHGIQKISRKQAIAEKLGPDPDKTYANIVSRAIELNPAIEKESKHKFDAAYNTAKGKVLADYGASYKTNEMVKNVVQVGMMHSSGISALSGDMPGLLAADNSQLGTNLGSALADNVTGFIGSVSGTIGYSFHELMIQLKLKEPSAHWLKEQMMDMGVDMEDGHKYTDGPFDTHEVELPGIEGKFKKTVNMLSGATAVASKINSITNFLKPFTYMGKTTAAGRANAFLKKFTKLGFDKVPERGQRSILAGMDKEDFHNLALHDGDFTFSNLEKLKTDEMIDKMVIPEKYFEPLRTMEAAGMDMKGDVAIKYAEQVKRQYAAQLKEKAMAFIFDYTNKAIATPDAKTMRKLGAGYASTSNMMAIMNSNFRMFKTTAYKVVDDVRYQMANYNSYQQKVAYLAARTAGGMVSSMSTHLLVYALQNEGRMPWEDEGIGPGEWVVNNSAYHIVRGGGLGIIGDYVIGAATRRDALIGMLGGPTSAMYANILYRAGHAISGEKGEAGIQGAQAIKALIKNTPFLGQPFLFQLKKWSMITMDTYIKELKKQQDGAQKNRHRKKRHI